MTYFYLLVHHLTHILLITLLQNLRWKRSSVNQKSPIKHCAKFFLSWKHSCCYIQEFTWMGYIPGFVITRRYLQYSWKSLIKLRRGCLYTLSPESISLARKLGLALLWICLSFIITLRDMTASVKLTFQKHHITEIRKHKNAFYQNIFQNVILFLKCNHCNLN